MNVLIETPTCVAWHEASRVGLTLDEYLRYVLRADWNSAHQNVDEFLANAEMMVSPELREAIDVYRRAPSQWLRKTRDSGRKSHSAAVYFCPDCLRTGEGELDLRWQLGFSCVCAQHQRLLINACLSCGELQRYRKGPGAGVHWLDCWRFCSSCGAEAEMAPYAPMWLQEVGEMLQGPPRADDVLQAACYRILTMLSLSSRTVATFAERAGLQAGVDHHAWCASAILWATLGPGTNRTRHHEAFDRFALVGVDRDGELGAKLCDVVCGG